ncbi:SecD/SecF fusion protein [Amycolatopsis xylanica]|uniref:Multifunctional fusion protein n=1 Tax=Amycolatopsis xylanica TaxID=589385 RepID=A0A1H2TYX7_9PSEU|nr:protein translocase subunit SecD [Amycolatopsis xylanica]SDW48374.1 SecD/SecF fusion protein [Amycolatopsis xylanica]
MPRPSARRGLLVRGLLSLAVLAASAFLLLTSQPRLGLDLKGGTQIVLETHDSPTMKADAKATDDAMEVIRRRVDALGVAEPVLARSGDNRILVELPGVQDPQEAIDILGRTAQLSMRPVLGTPGQTVQDGQKVLTDEAGQPLLLGPIALTGQGVKNAQAVNDSTTGRWVVSMTLQDTSAWQKLTADAACAPSGAPARRVAIVVDDKIVSAPQMDQSIRCGAGIIGDTTQITGDFTRAEAQELALVIRSGALPVPVEVAEQRVVGPTLGAEAIKSSAIAALAGLTLTAAFLLLAYRLAGLLAILALLGYAAVSYSVLLALGATLTLPGLAGFVLAIGMAIDANILIFERAREEYTTPRRLPRAASVGFRRALTAITDTNITTVIAAGLLFWLAAGPVKGFGVTLVIGVLSSLFSALVLGQVLLELAARNGFVQKHPGMTGLARFSRVRIWLTTKVPQLFRRPRRWLAAGLLLVAVCAAGVATHGLNLGVEFTGGRMIEYTAQHPVDPGQVRAALTEAGFDRAVVASSGDSTVTVRTEPIDEATAGKIKAVVDGATGGAQQTRDDQIGPSVGAELRTKAVLALGLAVAAQLGYLAVRFDWRLGLATVASLVADVVVVVGAFAWLGKPVDGVFLAALLTVIGLSVNDSVVVFDRLRELRAARPKDGFASVMSAAVLQTLPRTVNTCLGVLFMLLALLVLGDGSLADFAVALLIGLVAGTASTVLTAAPVAIMLDARRGA